MILKILMSSCYKEEFQAEGHTYIKKLVHCKCKEKHFRDLITDEQTCNCKNGLSHEVCGFCFSVRYLLNFKCFKICVEEVPDNFIEGVVSLDYYFNKIKCGPLFSQCKN